jgi:hypothetical protein
MAKKEIKEKPLTPCRKCSSGDAESNFMIFCKELGHCEFAGNKYCSINKFVKK